MLSNKDEIRISILVALAIGEIVGILHFYGQPKLAAFFIMTLPVIVATIPLLWIESLQRRGISYFSVLFGICACTVLATDWENFNLFRRLTGTGLAVALAMVLMLRLRRKLDITRQEASVKTIREEDARIGRVLRNAIGLLACIFLTVFLGHGQASPLWAIPLAIPASWFTWRTIVHLFIRKWSVDDSRAPSGSLADQRGSA